MAREGSGNPNLTSKQSRSGKTYLKIRGLEETYSLSQGTTTILAHLVANANVMITENMFATQTNYTKLHKIK